MLRESRYDVPELKKQIKDVFHVSIQMRASLARVAQQLGWQAAYSTGDSDVHIAKYGGTVITNDSDFLFFTNITGVIFHRQLIEEDLPHFVYYEKKAVLDASSLSEEKWIALGIVLTKDYNLSQTHLELDTTYQLLRNHVDEDGTHTPNA
jgi:hypothetical protein